MRPFVAFGALGVFVALPALAQNAVPVQAQNQQTTTTTTTTQGGGGGGAAPAAQGGQGGQAGGDKAQSGYGEGKGSGNMGGYSYDDKPKRTAGAPAKARAVKKHAGPVVNLPGFEQTPDGGSRVFVSLTSTVPVEEHKAQGAVTYVLKGAGVRVWNNTNALVTVHFNTPVSKARLVPHGNDAHLVIEMRAASTPTWKMTEGQDKSAVLQIDFPKGDFAPADKGDGPELQVNSGGGDGGDEGTERPTKAPNSGTPAVPKKKGAPGKPAGTTKPGPTP
jgi:hypothetical protein